MSTSDTPDPNTPTLTLAEAAANLTTSLLKYSGPEGWQCVGYSDEPGNPHLIIYYTSTRARVNQLLAFIGYYQNGFKVVGKTLGRVTLVPKTMYPRTWT